MGGIVTCRKTSTGFYGNLSEGPEKTERSDCRAEVDGKSAIKGPQERRRNEGFPLHAGSSNGEEDVSGNSKVRPQERKKLAATSTTEIH